MSHHFEVKSTELLSESPILALRRDQVTMPGGGVASREVVEHFGAVAIAAVNEHGEIALIRQYRHSVADMLVELPAGLLDMDGETALRAAQRELQEEAGLAAGRWSVLVDLVTSPGFCDEAVRVFLAQDLSRVEQPELSEEEAEMTLEWLLLDDAVSAALAGKVVNSIAVSGIFAASEVLSGRAHARECEADFTYRPKTLADRRRAAGVGPDMKKLKK